MEVLCVKKGLKTISGFSRIELLSSVIILAATLGMGMRTYLQADNYLQLAASDVQFQAEAQLTLLQISNELRQAADAQIVDDAPGQMPPTVIFTKAVASGKESLPQYQLVSYGYNAQNGVGSLLRSVRSHGSQSQIQPLDLKIARENSPSHVAEHTQILLTDARPEQGENTSNASLRLNQLTLKLLASTPAAIIRKQQAKS